MLIVIGGGPAGFFGAIRARETAPARPVMLLEKSSQVLRKVSVSGGGRCNVTQACFEPRELISRYPRGSRELQGPFHTFGPRETVAWFAERGVELTTEPDGRMFPVTNSSDTIVSCLREAARQTGVDVRTGVTVTALDPNPEGFSVTLASGESLAAEAVLLATGGQTSGGGETGYDLAAALGHTIVPPVPSLFSFRIADPLLAGLAGVAVPQAQVRITGARRLTETGPLLITHRGLSGPVVLRLSSRGARYLHDCGYRCEIVVNWAPGLNSDQIDQRLQAATRNHGKQQIQRNSPLDLPKRLWQALAVAADISVNDRWADLGRQQRRTLTRHIDAYALNVDGQATNKEEFVTCGGVALPEIDFRTMASRVSPGLFLAGELVDIDGITGGYNFQACWTTGWLAGSALSA